ncbi:hypothetical protein BRARA_J00776, partial [Brassica rapa]
KKYTNYGTIFVYCFFCLVFIVEVVRFAKPYYNFENLMETEAVIIEETRDTSLSSVSVPARSHKKLSATIREETRTRPPVTYCV